MASGEIAAVQAPESSGLQSVQVADQSQEAIVGAIRHTNSGLEGRFELKKPGAETLRYVRPNAVTASFESEIQGSIVYLHKLSQPKEYYIVRGTPSITQLLSNPGPVQYMANLPDYKNAPGNPDPDLVWIHLPANNMSWVEALATIRYKETTRTADSSDQTKEEPLAPKKDSAKKAADKTWDPQLEQDPAGQLFLLSSGVWTQRQYTGRYDQPSKQERFLQPLYSRISTLWSYTIPVERDISSESEMKPNSVIFMPYIHWEQSDSYLLRNKCLDWMIRKEFQESTSGPVTLPQDGKEARANETATTPWSSERSNAELRDLSGSLDTDSKLLLAYIHEDSPLHVRRTLDQSFYYTLPDQDIRDRDLDQVLYRYTNGDLKMTSPRILMVDQLWLWIIDEPDQPRTVITAFPQKWGSIPRVLDTSPVEPSSLPPAPPSPDPLAPNIAKPASIHKLPSPLSSGPATTTLPTMKSWQPRYRALYDFTGENDNKVSFKKDEILALREKGKKGWWLIESGSGKGWAPSTYLKEEQSPGVASTGEDKSVPTIEFDRSQFYGRIFSALQQAEVEKSSTEDLVSLIIDKCSGLFHPCHDEIDHVLDYLEVFAIAIGKVADRQTSLHNALCTHSKRMQLLQERSREMSSASLRERWGGQDKSSTSQPAAQAPNTPVKGFHNAGKVILKVSGAPSITEKWSSFHDTAGTVGVPAVNFPDLSEALRKGTIPEIELLIEHEINELVNITSETECMKEIKDILDELNIISSIFKQQLKIVNAMGEDHTDASSATEVSIGQQASGGKGKEIETPEVQKIIQEYVEHSGTKYKKLYQTLKGREQDIEALKTEATRVYQAICDLLDLKQKQASVSEAYSARQEAKESARQGKTILLFTIVTIIFLPLSFVAGIFSMNAKEINGYTGRTAGAIVTIMLPFTLATLLFALLLAYNTSIKWFLIGLFTWFRNRQNTERNSAKMSVKMVSRSKKSSEAGTTSSPVASANANSSPRASQSKGLASLLQRGVKRHATIKETV